MALLLCERQQNWLRVVTVVFRTIGILLLFFTLFTFFERFFGRVSYVFSNYDLHNQCTMPAFFPIKKRLTYLLVSSCKPWLVQHCLNFWLHGCPYCFVVRFTAGCLKQTVPDRLKWAPDYPKWHRKEKVMTSGVAVSRLCTWRDLVLLGRRTSLISWCGLSANCSPVTQWLPTPSSTSTHLAARRMKAISSMSMPCSRYTTVM